MTTINDQHIISVTENALEAVAKLKKEKSSDKFLLRIGVRQGGCSGLSYVMHIEHPQNVTCNDKVIHYPNFKIICNFKSLLFLYGLSLDYKDDLVGGGFCFINPNANQTCGCGKSFSANKI